MNEFGVRLAEIRKSKQLSQRDLAKILQKPFTALSKYERGETIPSIEIVKQIAKALDVSVSYFLEDADGTEFLANKKMIQRVKDIEEIDSDSRDKILYALDSMLRDAKTRLAYK